MVGSGRVQQFRGYLAGSGHGSGRVSSVMGQTETGSKITERTECGFGRSDRRTDGRTGVIEKKVAKGDLVSSDRGTGLGLGHSGDWIGSDLWTDYSSGGPAGRTDGRGGYAGPLIYSSGAPFPPVKSIQWPERGQLLLPATATIAIYCNSPIVILVSSTLPYPRGQSLAPPPRFRLSVRGRPQHNCCVYRSID